MMMRSDQSFWAMIEFWPVSVDFGGTLMVSYEYDGFWWVMMGFNGFWWVMMVSDGFWCYRCWWDTDDF